MLTELDRTLYVLLEYIDWGFLGGPVVKNLPANAGDIRDTGSVSGLGRSAGEGNGNPLENMGRGAWRATVHGVAKSQR